MAPAAQICPLAKRAGDAFTRAIRLAATRPRAVPRATDRNSPAATRSQGPERRLDSPPGSAAAAPESPAARAWRSLVGMPNRQARTAQHTMAAMAAHSAVRAPEVLRPKSAIVKMVSDTAPPATAAHRLPSRLQAAASQAARRKGSTPDTTAEAMALGASVQPLIRMTASSRSTVTARAGLAAVWRRKSKKDRGMDPPPGILWESVRSAAGK